MKLPQTYETARYTDTIRVMPRTNQDGKDIKLVVGWLCGRHVSDAEMAEAVGIPTTNYSRRKDAEDFPSFEELGHLAKHFGLNPLALQSAFGYLDLGAVLLDDEGMRQYVEQGGGEAPNSFTQGGKLVTRSEVVTQSRRRMRRKDAPPGP